MSNADLYYVWFTENFKRFFLIPRRTVLEPGLDSIYDLQENQKLVSLEAISAYSCSQEEAKVHLYTTWQESLKSTKEAWLNLYNFSQKTGQEINFPELGEQFREGLQMAGTQAKEAFETGQAFVESIIAAANNQETRTESEQQALFKSVFAQLPQLLEQFSNDKLEAAAKDPDAWAEKLYQQVFGELDKNKHEKQKQILAKDIRESIAKGLRSAGMTPSMDWEKGKRNTK